jgi:ferredoxin
MAKYKVIFDRELCIGALSCFGVNPDRFKLADDTKVDLVGGTLNTETQKWELVFTDDEYEAFKNSADVCPVQNTIVVEKLEE